MMLSKIEARKKVGEGSGNGKLLHEIEVISKALYPEKQRPKNSVSTFGTRSKSVGKTLLPESKSKLKDWNEDYLGKDKKSIWNWKPLKAFTNVRNRSFNCCFTLEVHSIEGLPSYFDNLSLCVHWKRRDGGLVTRPARVVQGLAEFEEQLKHVCSVYGSRSSPHHSAKYEAKHFLLYAAVYRNPELDLGKHRVDITRLLPLTFEELEDEKSTGKWTTSYRLSGKAKGATLSVSFGYSVIGNNSFVPQAERDAPEMPSLKQNNTSRVEPVTRTDRSDCNSTTCVGSLAARRSASSRSIEDIKDLHEVLPASTSELSSSIDMLYQKLAEEKLHMIIASEHKVDVSSESTECLEPNSCASDSGKENAENVGEDGEFCVTEHGIELTASEQDKSEQKDADNCPVRSIDIPEVDVAMGIALEDDAKPHPMVEELGNPRDELVISDKIPKVDDSCNKELLMKDLEVALSNVSDLALGMDSPNGGNGLQNEESFLDVKSNYKTSRKVKSLSLDDSIDSIADQFLDMVGIEHSPFGLSSESEPESPRERLLRQFEKDILASGCPLFNFDTCADDQAKLESEVPIGYEYGALYADVDLSSVVEAGYENPKVTIQSMRHKTRASTMEDLETEALMREWGLNENAFQGSPPDNSGEFGSPIDLPPEEPLQLPPLGEGLGPFVQTRNGGFLRSMNPALFRNAKSDGSLVMQVSSSVVVPAEMGSSIMEILQCLASVGIEKLSMQANKLMPLEDITGMTVQQIAWETTSRLDPPERQVLSQQESEVGQNVAGEQNRVKGKSSGLRSSKMDSSGNEMDLEYVSLEDLAPLAMDKIEAISIEGLRIQCGMSDEDAPTNITAQSIGQISTIEGKRGTSSGSSGLEGAGGLQLLDIKDTNNDVDGLMGLSLTLDEWMRLDSGQIDDEDQISERTSRILAAHHASSLDSIRGRSKGEKRRGKSSGRRCGLLGNNFTVALMVQLRDPLRNYEPVGTPMLALIQVERLFVPAKMKIYSTVSKVRERNEDDDESEPAKKEEVKEEQKEEEIHDVEALPQFKITEVHVAGLKTEPGKKKIWGSSSQQQSGSRWLLANGMGRTNKHPFMKSKAVNKSSPPLTTTAQPGDTLWSISSRVHGTGAKWKELAALNPHIRNPNVILPNETIRLR